MAVDHAAEATPSKAAMQQLLSRELNAKPEQVDIRNIYTNFGRQSSRAKVFVWAEAKVPDLSKAAEKPAEGEAAPAEGEAKPAEEKPAEGKAKPEEKPKEGKGADEKPAEEKKE